MKTSKTCTVQVVRSHEFQTYIYIYIYIYMYFIFCFKVVCFNVWGRSARPKHAAYIGCHRRNEPNFGRVFLMLNYTDITQNTYFQSWTVTEIMAREKCGHFAFPRTVRLQLCSALTWSEHCGTHFCDSTSSAQRDKIAFHYCRYVQCLVTLRTMWHECECFCSSI